MTEIKLVPFTKYFHGITNFEKVLLVGGTLSAIVAGLILPSISLVMGNIAKAFSGTSTADDLLSNMASIGGFVVLIALGIFIFSYIFYSFWQHLAANITLSLKKKYIEALLRQEISYFERNKVEQIPAQITEIFDNLQNSIGEKVSNLIFALSTCLASIGYAFYYGWVFALICVMYLPFLMGIIAFFGRSVQRTTIEKVEGVKQLAGVAEETIMSMKVVASYCQEDREIKKFMLWAYKTSVIAKNYQQRYCLTVGMTKFSIFLFYAYALFIGSVLIQYKVYNYNTKQDYDGQIVIQTIIALITGFVGLIAALPNVQAIMAAKTLGTLIFAVIERIPEIDNIAGHSDKLSLVNRISFENISFRYPTADPERKPVFENASFQIRAGETTVIVGPSGSGKSTIIQLLQRFYDPQEGGSIKFDGQNIKDCDLGILRERIGYVSQEPVLIMGSIRDNLLFGNKDATEEECWDALQQANATFVQSQLSDGLDTFVGTASAANMSGGQKQKIAIARALIKKPLILILDEATSALDPKSENEVQKAIEIIQQSDSKLTIIMIAHRLSTIATADNLLYFESSSKLISARRNTDEYFDIMEKITIHDQNVDLQSSDESELGDSGFAFGIQSSGSSSGNSPQVQPEKKQNVDSKKQPSLFVNDELVEESSLNFARNSGEIKINSPETLGALRHDSCQSPLVVDSKEVNVDEIVLNSNSSLSHLSQGSQMSILNKQRSAKIKKDQEFVHVSMGEQLEPVNESYRDIKISEIMKDYQPKWYAVVGFMASVAASLQLPLFGYVLSQFIFVLLNFDKTFIQMRNQWTGVFVLLCIGIGTSTYLQKLCFAMGGENLTYVLRVKLFNAMLHKSVGWFEDKSHAAGVLTNVLTEDIQSLNGLTTESIAIAVEAALGLFFSCLICFLFTWQVALVITITCPFMVLGGLGMSKLQFSQKDAEVSSKLASALLNDIILNYRTVVSFGHKNVQFILDRYATLLIGPNQATLKRAHVSGLFFGYSQSIRFVYIAFVFYIAALFSQRYNLNRQSVFTACYVVFVGAIGSGVSMSQMPSVSKAKQSAQQVFKIIETPSEINPKQQGVDSQPTGLIQFKGLSFKYASRKRSVFKNLNLTIYPNESVAIVGHSGSGKSTIASLLLRFYDCNRGQVLIDGKDIKEYNLKELRSNISIVQQEPMLWNESIRDNICYGQADATNSQIKSAAVQANVMSFILADQTDDQILAEFKSLNVVSSMLKKCQDLLDSGGLEYRQIKLVTEVLKRVNERALNTLEERFEDFIRALILSDGWQNVIRMFVFQTEAKKIKNYVIVTQPEEVQSDIEKCLVEHPCEFDFQTVEAYCKLRNKKKMNFNMFRTEQDVKRVRDVYDEKIQTYLNQEAVMRYDEELEPGFSKVCGIKGSKMSGGQKQRIAIARALIKKPKILILDEATSALDEQSQLTVQEALEKAMQGRTSIVIAHRMSTIRSCSRICVLHRGKVVEDGTYEDLMQIPGGHFQRLAAGIA